MITRSKLKSIGLKLIFLQKYSILLISKYKNNKQLYKLVFLLYIVNGYMVLYMEPYYIWFLS